MGIRGPQKGKRYRPRQEPKHELLLVMDWVISNFGKDTVATPMQAEFRKMFQEERKVFLAMYRHERDRWESKQAKAPEEQVDEVVDPDDARMLERMERFVKEQDDEVRDVQVLDR